MFGFWKLGRVDWTLDADDMPSWHPSWQTASRYPTNLPKPAGRHTGMGGVGFVWSSLLAEIARDPIGPPKAVTTIGATMWPAPLVPPPTARGIA